MRNIYDSRLGDVPKDAVRQAHHRSTQEILTTPTGLFDTNAEDEAFQAARLRPYSARDLRRPGSAAAQHTARSEQKQNQSPQVNSSRDFLRKTVYNQKKLTYYKRQEHNLSKFGVDGSPMLQHFTYNDCSRTSAWLALRYGFRNPYMMDRLHVSERRHHNKQRKKWADPLRSAPMESFYRGVNDVSSNMYDPTSALFMKNQLLFGPQDAPANVPPDTFAPPTKHNLSSSVSISTVQKGSSSSSPANAVTISPGPASLSMTTSGIQSKLSSSSTHPNQHQLSQFYSACGHAHEITSPDAPKSLALAQPPPFSPDHHHMLQLGLGTNRAATTASVHDKDISSAVLSLDQRIKSSKYKVASAAHSLDDALEDVSCVDYSCDRSVAVHLFHPLLHHAYQLDSGGLPSNLLDKRIQSARGKQSKPSVLIGKLITPTRMTPVRHFHHMLLLTTPIVIRKQATLGKQFTQACMQQRRREENRDNPLFSAHQPTPPPNPRSRRPQTARSHTRERPHDWSRTARALRERSQEVGDQNSHFGDFLSVNKQLVT